jgi:hypothetical protein
MAERAEGCAKGKGQSLCADGVGGMMGFELGHVESLSVKNWMVRNN